MEFIGYVEDYRLRNYLKIGQTVTILNHSYIRVTILNHSYIRVTNVNAKPGEPIPVGGNSWGDQQVEIVNFLPGYTDIYADNMGKRGVHNARVVWKDERGFHCDTDINNVKEIQDAKG
jgi:hypothetical protein